MQHRGGPPGFIKTVSPTGIAVARQPAICQRRQCPDDAVALPDYRARIESVAIFEVEAWDWNCPQHLTPRFTMEEAGGVVMKQQARIAELEREIETLKTSPSGSVLPD